MLEFDQRETVNPSIPSDDFVIAPNGIRFSKETAKLAGLI